MRLAIVTTHPIQYNAPWFRLLAQREGLEVKVFYTWEQSASSDKYDPGFGKKIQWDLPLLEGYEYTFVKNISKQPGSHHFRGIDNPTLNSEIEAWHPDAILVTGWAFRSHLKCLKYFKGKVPVLFRGDSTLLNEKPGVKRILRRMFLRYVYSFVDYALYVGADNKDYFLAHGLKPEQLVFVPHAVDNDRFGDTTAVAAAAEWRKELGIPADAFVVLFAGKLNANKNPELLLKAAAEIKNEKVYFLLVGNGPMEGTIKSANSDKRVRFLDFQNQTAMPAVYNLCDLYLLPSFSETWGLAINEAMAAGKFVVTTNRAGCARDLIADGENGTVISPGNVSSLVAFINRILTGEISVQNMKQVNMRLLETYSFSTIVDNIYTLLQKLTDKH